MKTIYARKTNALDVPNDIAVEFTRENHRDSVPHRIAGMRSFGLETQDRELVAVAIMGNPRTAGKRREYSAELIRLTFKKGVRITGGASKLLKHVMNSGQFYDFFTYQDTTNEVTDLYELAGMRFVSQSKKKQYLVKDGLDVTTAGKNEKFSVGYVVQLGPDKIIGTNYGRDTGKSNIELFLESGYHLEETTGDRVYDWFSDELHHYVYKITSIDDDGKYYIGMSSKLKSEPDTYMGSGATKYIEWRDHLREKHGRRDVFKKEFLGSYPS